MIQLLEKYAPSALPVVSAIMSETSKSHSKVYRCPTEWAQLIKSLASTSPVCSLLHPSESVDSLVHSMMEKDVTTDAVLMHKLQEEVPVIFQLIRSLGYYPKDVLVPLVENLWKKANSPFVSDIDDDHDSSSTLACGVNNDLCYFPALTKVRSRGLYVADKKSNDTICTKRTSKHPALLPGIFTLFCQHGVYSNFTCHSI